MLFPFLLTGEARDWSDNQDHTTWEEGCRNFLKTYFPTSMIVQLRAEITGFGLGEKETLLEGWNRYKEMLKACPNVGMDNWFQVFTFYNGLPDDIKNNLDVAAGGSLTSKTATEAKNLIEVMAQKRNGKAKKKKELSVKEIAIQEKINDYKFEIVNKNMKDMERT